MLFITHLVELSNHTLYFLCQVNKQQTNGTSCAAFDYAVTLIIVTKQPYGHRQLPCRLVLQHLVIGILDLWNSNLFGTSWPLSTLPQVPCNALVFHLTSATIGKSKSHSRVLALSLPNPWHCTKLAKCRSVRSALIRRRVKSTSYGCYVFPFHLIDK